VPETRVRMGVLIPVSTGTVTGIVTGVKNGMGNDEFRPIVDNRITRLSPYFAPEPGAHDLP